MTDESQPRSEEFTLQVPFTGSEEVERLHQALEEKTREAEANHDRALRALADLDNYKKRVQREREEWGRYATESLLREILPVLDNFDRAIHAAKEAPQAESLLAGVDLIRRELLKALESAGVTPYGAEGERFDPERHEAVMRVEASEAPEGMVVQELRRGYLLNGKVLRPAQVSVAMRPGAAPEAHSS